MLSTGTRTASSACLSCQLRQILFGLNAKAAVSVYSQRCRQLSTTRRSRQEATAPLEQAEERRRDHRSYKYRHLHPNGRIIGKAGRRQRQQSEPLPTTSLGKPSEVIVMRDVVEEPSSSQHLRLGGVDLVAKGEGKDINLLDAEELEAAISKQRKLPEQNEVNASIDNLRPESNVLEERCFKRLSKQLLDGYNVRQLFRYLLQSLSAPSATSSLRVEPQDRISLQATPWRPGRTALEQRIGLVSLKKGDVGHTKAKLVEQILRNAWRVTIHTEEQQVGELELYLTSWQVALLFDRTTPKGKPYFQSFLDPLLVRSSNARPYRPDNVMRITARRRDAEEVARQLAAKLSEAGRLEVDLKVFKPLLGGDRWPQIFKDLFSEDALRDVAERTNSVIERLDEGTLAIYSILNQSRAHARRLLLALLDLPSPKDTEAIVPREGTRTRPRTLKTYSGRYDEIVQAEYSTANLHRRFRERELYRSVMPVAKQDDATSHRLKQPAEDPSSMIGLEAAEWRRLPNRLAGKLDKLPPLSTTSELLSSATPEDEEGLSMMAEIKQEPQWNAQICILLQESAKAAAGSARKKKLKSVERTTTPGFQHHVRSDTLPGMTELLSHFEPYRAEKAASADTESSSNGALRVDPPLLIAYLTPSPFSRYGIAGLKQLPRIALTFRLSDDTGPDKGQDVAPKLLGIRSVLREQELNVPIPDQAADVVFTRALIMYHHGNRNVNRDTDSGRGVQDISVSQSFIGSEDVQRFEEAIQRSFADRTGAIDALPELNLQLPSWVIEKVVPPSADKPAEAEPATVEYMLERFEQTQVVDFVPVSAREGMDADVEAVLSQWPEGLVLRRREVEAGAFGGRRTELTLTDRRSLGELLTAQEEVAQDDAVEEGVALDRAKHDGATPTAPTTTLQLTTTALGLLKIITKANAGLLKPFARPSDAQSAG